MQVTGADGRSVSKLLVRPLLTVSGLTRVLLPATGPWACPSSAAACMKVGDEYVNLGHVEAGPTMETSVLNLKYTGGQACPHGNSTRTSIIRFKCDKAVSDGRVGVDAPPPWGFFCERLQRWEF